MQLPPLKLQRGAILMAGLTLMRPWPSWMKPTGLGGPRGRQMRRGGGGAGGAGGRGEARWTSMTWTWMMLGWMTRRQRLSR